MGAASSRSRCRNANHQRDSTGRSPSRLVPDAWDAAATLAMLLWIPGRSRSRLGVLEQSSLPLQVAQRLNVLR